MNNSLTNGNFERRAQTIVQVIITSMVVWIGFTIVDMGKTVVRLEERSIQNTAAIAEMKIANSELKVQVTAAALAASNAATAAAIVAVAAQQKGGKP